MKIIFVCTGNTCRSPMAEGIFKKISQNSKKKFTVSSAGVCTETGISPSINSVIACEKIDVDIKNYKSTSITNISLDSIDLFVTMTKEHAYVLMQMGVMQNKIYVLNVEDPYGGNLEKYIKCRIQLEEALANLLKIIEKG